MPFYHSTRCRFPRKRHTVFRRPDGGLYSEELMGHEGFTGTVVAALSHPPAHHRQVGAAASGSSPGRSTTETSLRHRHFRTRGCRRGRLAHARSRPAALQRRHRDALGRARHPGHARLSERAGRRSRVRGRRAGGARIGQFGDLPFHAGDYVVIHRGIMHRWKLDPRPGRPSSWSSRARATSASRAATGTNSARSSRGRPTPSATSAGRPQSHTHDERGDFPIMVKQYDGLNEFVLDHHPFDVVGWDGCSIPGPSTSTTSSRSSAGFTSRRRCTRPSRATAS